MLSLALGSQTIKGLSLSVAELWIEDRRLVWEGTACCGDPLDADSLDKLLGIAEFLLAMVLETCSAWVLLLGDVVFRFFASELRVIRTSSGLVCVSS